MRRRARLAALVGAAAGCLAALPAQAAAAPVWRLDSFSATSIQQGGQLRYIVEARNVGDVSSSGAISLTATLPAGVTGVTGKQIHLGVADLGPCTAGNGVDPVAGANTVRCSTSESIAPNESLAMYLTVTADGTVSGTPLSSFQVSGGGAAGSARTVDPMRVESPPGFGVDVFDGGLLADAAGDPFTQAGGHPYAITTWIDFNTIDRTDPLVDGALPPEGVKDLYVDLPPGLVGDPTGVAQCTMTQLANSEGTGAEPLCPATSQVGTTIVKFRSLGSTNFYGPVPVFNIAPPPDVPARFGFNAFGSLVVLDAQLRTGGDYGLTVAARDIPVLGLAGSFVTFWGVPSAASHDAERACPGLTAPFLSGRSCSSGAPATAFLRNTTSCTDPGVGLTTSLRMDSWEHPGVFQTASFVSHRLPGYPLYPDGWGAQQGPTGCDRVPFAPTLVGLPTAGAKPSSPSGFSFDVALPQSDDPNSIGEGDLRTAVVTLPPGVSVNPSSANGLGACSSAQIDLHGSSEPTCPDSAKIGSVRLETPLLRDPLLGSVFLASPHDNPFDSLLAIYIVVDGPGVVVKLAGHVDADPLTGQLTTTFDNNPQLPFSRLHLEFAGGPAAPLMTPPECGRYTTNADLTSWSGAEVTTTSEFTLDNGGAPCPAAQFSPRFSAGTENPVAGKTTSFHLALTRGDGDQQLKALSVNMPTGLTGFLSHVSLCGETDAAAGTCGEGSRIGSVTVGAGAGSNPFYITNGRAYITGPYKGAPFGLSIVVPAVAGPFDLGDVVVRSALFVDKQDATLRVVSDPLPTILQGIPLDVRDVRVSIDRPHFIVNPTSCARKTIGGSIDSTGGMTAAVSDRFAVGECASLAFKPRMVLTVGGRGHTARGRTSPLSTTLTMPSKGQANLRYVRVTLPDSINARLTVIGDACTRQEFETDIAKCAHAKAGTATAVTPLLRAPLSGGVYFVKNGHPGLPDLFVALRGQVAFDLVGRISIPHSRFLRTTFATAPDVPVRSFTLRLFGDPKNGSLGAATNLCSAAARRKKAQLDYIAQNGRVRQVDQALVVRGCPKVVHHHAKRRR